MRVIDLGIISYKQCLELQLKTLAEVQAGQEDTLFVLEHFPVITFGRNGGEENLLFNKKELQNKGVELVKSSRGGNITCHFPGQVVVYPIFRLGKRKGGVKKFFFDLEEVVIQVLKGYDIEANRIEGLSGVFVKEKKICSIGIGVKRWISYHGLALNVYSDLSLFKFINPCGLNREMTAIHLESEKKTTIKEVKKDLVYVFNTLFT
ncbi:lipoyl(octanoyl) transferase LipB [Desulfonauticus submarinus]